MCQSAISCVEEQQTSLSASLILEKGMVGLCGGNERILNENSSLTFTESPHRGQSLGTDRDPFA